MASTTSVQVKELLKVDAAISTRALKKYDEISSLLENTCTSVAVLSRLVQVASQSEDFELVGKGSLMRNQSFSGTLVQAADDGCNAFMFTNEQYYDIQTVAEKIPTKLKYMVDKFEDSTYLSNLASQIASESTAAASTAAQVLAKFDQVRTLFNEMLEEFVKTKNSMEKVTKPVADALLELSRIQQMWDQVNKFFSKTAVLIKVDLVGDAAEFRNTAVLPNVIGRRFADKAVRLCVTAILVTSLVDTFARVLSDHLDANIQDLSSAISDVKGNQAKFLQLEQWSWDAGDAVRSIVKECRLNLSQSINDITRLLVE